MVFFVFEKFSIYFFFFFSITAKSGFPSRLRHRTRPWLLPFKVARHFSRLNFFHGSTRFERRCVLRKLATIERVLVHLRNGGKRRLDQVSLLSSTLRYLWRCVNFVVNFPRSCGGKPWCISSSYVLFVGHPYVFPCFRLTRF